LARQVVDAVSPRDHLLDRRSGSSTQPKVVTAFAHGLRNDAESHQEGEGLAADAKGEDRLQRGRDEHETDQHERRVRQTEPEMQYQRGDGEGGPDPLGEALGRPGHEARCKREPRRHHPGDELAQGAQRRTGEHPSDEAVREWDQQPRLVQDEREDGEDDHPRRDQACGDLIDRGRKGEEIAHQSTLPPKLTRTVRFGGGRKYVVLAIARAP
jgi:hypothetical protein